MDSLDNSGQHYDKPTLHHKRFDHAYWLDLGDFDRWTMTRRTGDARDGSSSYDVSG